MKVAAIKAHDSEYVLAAALRYLSLRPRSEAELSFRLHRRGFDEGVIAQVLTQLKEQHLVDDVGFARFWVENRGAFSPRSYRLLKQELKGKGIAPDIITEVTAEVDDEFEAYQAVRKKARLLRGMDYPQFRHKLTAFLRRRGFDYEVIGHTINRVWKEEG
jgi:regulatory protein